MGSKASLETSTVSLIISPATRYSVAMRYKCAEEIQSLMLGNCLTFKASMPLLMKKIRNHAMTYCTSDSLSILFLKYGLKNAGMLRSTFLPII
ncbi:Uncharacterised protein [uncultured archaeon]|nr:Uncharacterised protein [uncultured archaeon]